MMNEAAKKLCEFMWSGTGQAIGWLLLILSVIAYIWLIAFEEKWRTDND